MAKRSITSTMYKYARLSNDMHAAAKGPVALAKRMLRKKIYSKTNSAGNKICKRLGL